MKLTKTPTSTTTILTVTSIALALSLIRTLSKPKPFDGNRAHRLVNYQVSLGPRFVGSREHEKVVSWIMYELQSRGWNTATEEEDFISYPITNVIGRRGNGKPWVILGAHYDTRIHADRDPDIKKRNQPVLGANDGGSGVAVLLELARVIPKYPSGEIWLLFFDAEDNGDIPGWDWILGSRAFVANLKSKPDAVVIVDMVGDADLNLYREKNSTPWLSDDIWIIADSLGYSETFVNQPKYSILDDHTPFLEVGIPAVDIIDFDYPYWHTTEDTLDKVSASSLQVVGEVLLEWLDQFIKGVKQD